MFGVITKSGPLGQLLVASSQSIPNLTRGIIPAVSQVVEKGTEQPSDKLRHHSLSALLPSSSFPPKASSGLAGTHQYRYAHTDIQVPDFGAYRRDSLKSPVASNKDSHDGRNSITYVIGAGGLVATVFTAKSLVQQLINTMNASADVLALAKIEVKLSDIPEGKNVTFKWRGKPLFVRHRTAEEIATEQAVDPASLRDQEHDNDRVKNPDWLVVIGVCTHLGCVPVSNAGEYGGYYCPCHGSHYDSSGRIRKGPAPLNLEVPEYEFPTEDTLLVG